MAAHAGSHWATVGLGNHGLGRLWAQTTVGTVGSNDAMTVGAVYSGDGGS